MVIKMFEKVDCSKSVEEFVASKEQSEADDGQNKGPEKAGPIFDVEGQEKARKLFPERGGDEFKSSWWAIAFKGQGREKIDRMKCERNVYNCVKTSHLVKIMLGALSASGCPIDLRRHISCEVCDESVTGGFDPILNQVVVCQNTARSQSKVQGVLSHEFIHMFDFCRHNLDFKNLKHLACTEIRAANLVHCSFISSIIEGSSSPFNIKGTHKDCVRHRAYSSVKAVRNVSDEEAYAAIDAVFDKCYKDLEPVGRRLRRNSDHMEKAFHDRIGMGYD